MTMSMLYQRLKLKITKVLKCDGLQSNPEHILHQNAAML